MAYYFSHSPEVRTCLSYTVNALKCLLNGIHSHREFLCGLVILSVTAYKKKKRLKAIEVAAGSK